MNLSNPYWHCTGRGNRLLIRCLHPRPTTQLIRHLTLTWDDGTSRRAEGLGCRSGAGSDYEIDAGSTSPSSMQAELDLRHEYESLRQLRPQAGVIDQWLEGLRRNKKRWRGLVLAADSGDPTLTVTKHYNKRFTPLLCKLAILFGVNDPGLAVVMGFSPRGRQLHAWLMLIQPATPLHLPLLQLNPQGEVGHEVRLLALSRMIKQADRHNPFAPAAPLGTVPLLQYWEGSPIPEDIEVQFQNWEATFSEAQIQRLDATGALDWIKENSEHEDFERFQRCWHPAMQSDLLRVLFVARNGGVYLDGDTPLPSTNLTQERWRQLMHYCHLNNVLAVCINSISRPGDIRYYAVNCCIWASPLHVKMQEWVERHRQAFDNLPCELIGTPQGIHHLGPELISKLVDQWICEPGTVLTALQWQDVTMPLVEAIGWRLLLIDTNAYRSLFEVPFSAHASYQGNDDPRDWKLGIAIK